MFKTLVEAADSLAKAAPVDGAAVVTWLADNNITLNQDGKPLSDAEPVVEDTDKFEPFMKVKNARDSAVDKLDLGEK